MSVKAVFGEVGPKKMQKIAHCLLPSLGVKSPAVGEPGHLSQRT